MRATVVGAPKAARCAFQRLGGLAAPVAAFVLASALVIACLACFQARYLTNDDVTMVSFLNGDYTGQGDVHLIVSTVFPGKALTTLYGAMPAFPWYTIVLTGCWILTWSCAFRALWRSRHGRGAPMALLSFAALLVVVPTTALLVSFTPAAIAVSTAGLVVLALAAVTEGRRAGALAIAGVLALAVGGSLRSQATIAIGIAFLPAWAAIAHRAGWRRAGVVAIGVVALTFGITASDRALYERDEGWAAFLDFREEHRQVGGSQRLTPTPELQSTLDEFGWTDNDLYLFSQFAYADAEVYTPEAVKAIREATSYLDRKPPMGEIARSLFDSQARVVAPTVFLVLLAVAGSPSWSRRLLLLASAAWFLAVLAGLSAFIRLPFHLAMPMWAAAAIVVATVPPLLAQDSTAVPYDATARMRNRRQLGLGAAALAVALSVGVSVASTLDRTATELNTRLERELRTLQFLDPQGVFVATGLAVMTPGMDPLDPETPFGRIQLVELGWPTFTPLFERRVRQFALSDVYGDLVGSRHVYLVAPADMAERLARFHAEHRDLAVEIAPVAAIDAVIPVWRLSPARAHP